MLTQQQRQQALLPQLPFPWKSRKTYTFPVKRRGGMIPGKRSHIVPTQDYQYGDILLPQGYALCHAKSARFGSENLESKGEVPNCQRCLGKAEKIVQQLQKGDND